MRCRPRTHWNCLPHLRIGHTPHSLPISPDHLPCAVSRLTPHLPFPSTIPASRCPRPRPRPCFPLHTHDQTVMVIPENLAVTRVDAESHPVVGPLAAEASELTALTLWLLAERAAGAGSNYAGLLATLPVRVCVGACASVRACVLARRGG